MAQSPSPRVLTPPLSDEDVMPLRAGDRVLISGVIYTARDAAHRRMADALQRGERLPFDPAGQVIYYTGPTPAPPGKPIGSAGPTTSYRMDAWAPALYAAGIRATSARARARPRCARQSSSTGPSTWPPSAAPARCWPAA